MQPARPREGETKREPRAHREPVVEPGSDLRVVVIAESFEQRVAIREVLQAAGVAPVEAASHEEAMSRVVEGNVSAALIVSNPTGLELARKLKRTPSAAMVPVVFVIPRGSASGAIDEAFAAGAADCIREPLTAAHVRVRLEALEALRRALTERDRRLRDNLPDIVWTATPEGRIDFLNRQWLETTGLPLNRTEGIFRAAVHPDDLDGLSELWSESLLTGRPFETEFRVRTPEGSYRWHLCRGTPERARNGTILGWLGTLTDIDERKRAHTALAEFRATLDAVLDAVMIFDPRSLRLLYANEGAVALLGFSRDELLSMRATSLATAYGESHFRTLLTALVREARPRTFETRLRAHGARLVPVEVSVQHVAVDGGRFVAIARDITERKESELEHELLYREVLDALQRHDDLLSLASHEFKTPLTTIKLHLEAILRRSHRGEAAEPSRLQVMGRQVDHLAQLVDQLLDVSHIRAGRLELKLEEIDLQSVVRRVIAGLNDRAASAGSSVAYQADGAVVGRWDRARIEQVITNVLSNAIKFGDGKPVEVRVERAGPVARVVVHDHGIGIAPEDRERIFERFERTVSLRRYAGLGLGLYVAQCVVRAHGGTISVESEPGAGSTFVVELPMDAG